MASVLLAEHDCMQFDDADGNAMRDCVKTVWGIRFGMASWAGVTDREKQKLHNAAWRGFMEGNKRLVVEVGGRPVNQ